MERMTERSESGHAYYPQCFKEPCEGVGCEIEQCKFSEEACDRLAAYEDTGLTPEEVERSKLEIEAGCVKAIARTYGIDINRLRKFAEADRDGRVIVLPCEVGHAAYWVHNGIITDCHINRIQVNRKGVFLCLKNKKSHGAFRVDTCLGKTVFLTREEAEKALAERKGMNE